MTIPEPWPQIIIAIIGPGGAVGTLFLLYAAALRSRADECCRKLEERDKADAEALAAYRRRDDELLRSLQARDRAGGAP